MTWFETLTGCREVSPDDVRRNLVLDGRRLHSKVNGQSWQSGELETPSLGQLRELIRGLEDRDDPLSVGEVVADVQDLHWDAANRDALFQVASQFNLLEMTSPGVTPEAGVGIYEHDATQGPACAIAAGAGTIVRNYFAEVNGRVGQTADNQIDCLAGVGELLGNTGSRLWRMVNGYALASAEGLSEVSRVLAAADRSTLDALRRALRVGIQWETQVTLPGAAHRVTQVYCSAMPVAYTSHSRELWAPLAKLILEAAYEATLCAGVLNRGRTGSGRVFLTLLGGGVFGNKPDWIFAAIRRSLDLYPRCGLEVKIVSRGSSRSDVRRLVADYG